MTHHSEPARHRQSDRGSASLWLLATCLLVGLVATAAALRAQASLARHRVEAAADLAALAAAGRIGVDGQACAAAAHIAAANGAGVRSCVLSLAPDGRSGTVRIVVTSRLRLPVVGVRPVSANAVAERLPP